MPHTVIAGLCLDAVLAAAPAGLQRAEVMHWWTLGGESAAVRAFAGVFTKVGVTWVDSAIADGANARTAAINRTVGNDPPTVMQFSTDKQFDELAENDILVNADSPAVLHVLEAMHAVLQAAETCGTVEGATPIERPLAPADDDARAFARPGAL